MSQNIKPTRSELIQLKRKIKLAQSGYKLLKKKREGLIFEFFNVMKKAKTLRSDLLNAYLPALDALQTARLMESDLAIESIAMAVSSAPGISLKTKNILGVKVPQVEAGDMKKQYLERGFGIMTSASVDEAAAQYEKVIEAALKVAEIETTMKKLLKEIEKTKRRVNALEFVVIPRMMKQQQFIRLRLEEMERENTFRMKRIKKKDTGDGAEQGEFGNAKDWFGAAKGIPPLEKVEKIDIY
ncbi:V-type ATP synthase subunit D [Candidatus Woesearchaeota archaeon]|nr:V-type ATP synthase subunit D [Candidatus Woesearchaeota archaeon]